MYFESHAHYDDPRFDDDRDELLNTLLPQSGVTRVINVGSNPQTTAASVKLAERYQFIQSTVGCHPHYVKDLTDDDLAEFERLASTHKKVAAIGEIGLDFHHDLSPRDVQELRFRQQLEIVVRTGLPVVLHTRDATKRMLDTVTEYKNIRNGVVHCFSESAETAAIYVKLGFYIGVGGVVTFPKAKALVEVVRQVPLDRILIETDCPYLAPEPYRGKRNSSLYLPYIAAKIAEIKDIPLIDVIEQTFHNGTKLFGGNIND
jgi:TatD DNase family protein